MNRRGFLSSIGVAIAAWFTPKPTTTLSAYYPDTTTLGPYYPDNRYVVELNRLDMIYGLNHDLSDYTVSIETGPSYEVGSVFSDPHLDPKRLPL